MTRLVDWLDRRLVRIIVGGLSASLACVLLGLAVILAGCGAGIRDDSGTDGKTDGHCGELTDGCSP